MKKKDYYCAKYLLTFLFFVLCFCTSVFLNTEHAPDEAMRMLVPEFMVSHHALPKGTEEAVRNSVWGFSYALYPYFSSMMSAVFMGIASLFTTNAAVLLTAARLSSVLSGTGTLVVVFWIGEELFERREASLLLGILVGFLPQFVFLSSYLNNDVFAVFTVSLILYFWIRGMKSLWCKKDCVGLGISCGFCSLSYYNAYAFLLCSIFLFFVFLMKKKRHAKEIAQKALLVLVTALLIGGWFFVRNAVLHDGDFLGRRTAGQSAELYAQDDYKPSLRQTPAGEGWSFTETFLKTPEGRSSNWIFSTISSFIGSFSYTTVHLSMLLYLLFLAILGIGFLLFLLLGIRAHWTDSGWKLLLLLMMFLAACITLGLDMYNSYFSDYQPQGRYLMPAMIPLMLCVSDGYASLSEKLPAPRKQLALSLTLFPGACWLVLCAISYFGYLVPGCFSL